jgi:hypothetical protein
VRLKFLRAYYRGISVVALVGLFQFITGIWLMHCTYAITVELALGAKAWV